ncbi:MAG: HNH endonuclease [Thermoanaerobaculia bacterium]
MPFRPKKPCRQPGCGSLVDYGYCDLHKCQLRPELDPRPTAAARGYSSKWQRARAAFLLHHPLCEMECAREGRITAATVVDHTIPHRGDPKLFWDQNNWRSGCKTCHDRKTAREDGGFGNRR